MWIVKNQEKAHLLKLACEAYNVSYQEVLNKAVDDWERFFGCEESISIVAEINGKDGNTHALVFFEFDEVEEV